MKNLKLGCGERTRKEFRCTGLFDIMNLTASNNLPCIVRKSRKKNATCLIGKYLKASQNDTEYQIKRSQKFTLQDKKGIKLKKYFLNKHEFLKVTEQDSLDNMV